MRSSVAREALHEAFCPIVRLLCRHPAALKIEIKESTHGVLNGLLISVQAHKFDSPRIWGKGRSMYNSLGVVAESIGYFHRFPIRLGMLLDPVVGTEDKETVARVYGDRSYPIEGLKPDEYLRKLLQTIAGNIFPGVTPVVALHSCASGAMRFVITMSPQNPKEVQRQWVALSVIFKALCAPYGWMPTIDIDQSLPLPE